MLLLPFLFFFSFLSSQFKKPRVTIVTGLGERCLFCIAHKKVGFLFTLLFCFVLFPPKGRGGEGKERERERGRRGRVCVCVWGGGKVSEVTGELNTPILGVIRDVGGGQGQ